MMSSQIVVTIFWDNFYEALQSLNQRLNKVTHNLKEELHVVITIPLL
jgi:hypothetical protein